CRPAADGGGAGRHRCGGSAAEPRAAARGDARDAARRGLAVADDRDGGQAAAAHRARRRRRREPGGGAGARRRRPAQPGAATLLVLPLATPTTASGAFEEGAVPVVSAMAAQIALAASTELAVLDRGIAEQRAKVALARAQQVPDPFVQGGVTHRSPPEFDWGW